MASIRLLNSGRRGFQIASFPSASGFLDDHTEGAIIIGSWLSSLLFNKTVDPCISGESPLAYSYLGLEISALMRPWHMVER